jgi:DNA-binding NarL/FixJ family response regulator
MDRGEKCIHVLVAEDNPGLAAAICALIAAEPDMQVNASLDRACQLVDAAAIDDANVLVLDLNLHGESSMPALMQLLRTRPRLAVVVYSGHDPRDLGTAFARIEHCEYVAKTGDPDELIAAIRRAANKETGAGA